MTVAIPRKTLEKLSQIDDPDEFRAEVNRMMGNNLPVLMLNRILCAVYIENEQASKVRGPNGEKLLKPMEVIAEDIWQGKPALVIAVGPAVCVDDERTCFYGQKIEVGDWVTFKVGNSTQIEISNVPCRITEDRFIEAVYDDPRTVTS